VPLTVATISLPTYTVSETPDVEAVGAALDAVICENLGQDEEREVAVRSISLIDHPGHTHDSLAEIATGTDRYDPERNGPLHQAYDPYGVELHVAPCTISATSLRCPFTESPRLHITVTQSVFAKNVSDFSV
jgi:hypothetical protein